MNRCHFKAIYALKRTAIAVGGCLIFCSCHYLEPVGPPFTVSISLRDSIITIHDSLKIRVSVPDDGVWGVKFIWFVDSPVLADTTTDSVLMKVFSVRDTGMRRIVIKAVDGNGHESPPDVFYVNVIYHRPAVALHADTTAPIHASYTLRVSGTRGDSRIDHYSWYIDDPQKIRMTGDTLVSWIWGIADTGRHVIIVRAVDEDGIQSMPCSLQVNVICRPPSVRLFADTVAVINAPYSLAIRGTDADSGIVGYAWYRDDPLQSKATIDTLLTWVWGVADTGRHVIVARAFDRDSLQSIACSLHVKVIYQRPTIMLYADTMGFVGASYVLRISGTGGDNRIDRFIWYRDDSLASTATIDTLFTWVWGAPDTGRHIFAAYAIDRDGIRSNPASLTVTVLPGTPVITPLHDTSISSFDTLKIICHASDPNGTIVKYLWDFSGTGWNDSTADSSHILSYSGNGTVRVVVGARDNDGQVSIAAFTVTFNRPPDTIVISTPAPNDTLVLPEKKADCSVAFAFRSSDPDSDMIVYSLSWGPAIDSLSPVYQGTAQSAQVDGVGPGLCYWRLEARDSWGHRCITNGTVVVIREHRICFVGHSIVLGYYGDSASGGFRAGVLDSLRKTLGPYERLKAVGPVTSDNYVFHLPPADDSCMAVSGISAQILYNTMYVLPSLTADIWVLMIGVTDDYNPGGLKQTALLMDLMVGRNPDSRLYVLNGNPITPSNWAASYWLPFFNQGLTDSIAARVAGGAHVFQVDAFTALSDSSGQYDSTLFADGLHPNQRGYNRLRDVIFSTMENSNPPVIAKNR